ncbi:MAG: MlaD family protein [Pusillimonas sp.]
MEPRAHHVMIGLFVVIVVTAGLVFALWLGKYGKHTAMSSYVIVFNEPVRGLAAGSAVQFNGIKVGEVVNLSLDPVDIRHVRALINIQSAIPMTADTRARLVITGITGVSVISLGSGRADSPPLEAKVGQPYPELIAVPSPISQFMQNGDTLLAGVTELMHNANQMLSAENAARISRTLDNLESASAMFAEKRTDLGDLISTMGRASYELDDMLRAVNRLVTHDGQASLRSARQALDSVDKAAAGVARLVTDNQGAVAAGLQGMNELGPTLQELRMTLATLRATLRKLNDNPAGYLLGSESLQEVAP